MATHLFLCIHYSLSSHSVRVAQKNVVLHKKLVVSTRKIFHIKVRLPTKIMWVTTKYVVSAKKIMWHQKRDSCWLNMFSVAQKRNTLKPKNFRFFFCPNINPSEIISCQNYFSKIECFFFFFFPVTQMKIYIEDQFLGRNMWKKRTQYCWNDVLVMYLINTNYVVSFVINNMIAITVIFCLFLLSYGFDIFFVILNFIALWKVWSIICVMISFKSSMYFLFSSAILNWTINKISSPPFGMGEG